MNTIRKLLYGIIAILIVCACNFTTETIVVTATPTFTPIVTATTAATATATLTPTVTSTIRPQATVVVLPNCTIRNDWQIYYVASGDTLGNIATRTGTTVANLSSANCLANPNSIFAGQALRVPNLPTVPTATTRPNTPITVYSSDGQPSYDQCVVFVNGTPETTPLFFTANSNEPMNAYLGNWGLWMSTVNGFHQILIAQGNQVRNAFVRASNTSVIGTGCNNQNQNPMTQGDIQISPHLASASRIFDLRGGDTVSLTWTNAPGGLTNANFYLIETNGSRTLLGTDNNGVDGWSVNWVVRYSVFGQYVIAEGVGFNSAPFSTATTFPTTLYSNANASAYCVALNLVPLPIYTEASVQSEITGELPANTQWLVTNFANDGWITIRGGGYWVSGSLQVTYTGVCPNR